MLNMEGEPVLRQKLVDNEGDIQIFKVKADLRHVCVEALVNHTGRQNAEDKIKRFTLATKIQDSTEPISLKPSDIVLIKSSIVEMWNPMIVGRAFPLLEPEEEATE